MPTNQRRHDRDLQVGLHEQGGGPFSAKPREVAHGGDAGLDLSTLRGVVMTAKRLWIGIAIVAVVVAVVVYSSCTAGTAAAVRAEASGATDP